MAFRNDTSGPAPRAAADVYVFPAGQRGVLRPPLGSGEELPLSVYLDGLELPAATLAGKAPRRKTALVKGRRARLDEGALYAICTKGHALSQSGQLDTARRIFEAVIATGTREAFPFTMLGTVYVALGDHERALGVLNEALSLDRGDLAARVYRGEVRLGRGEVKQAADDFERVVQAGSRGDPFVLRAEQLLQVAERQGARASLAPL